MNSFMKYLSVFQVSFGLYLLTGDAVIGRIVGALFVGYSLLIILTHFGWDDEG